MEKSLSELNSPRLTEDEALAYQAHAAEVSQVEFSSEATLESYKEAEELIQKLRDAQFDWIGVDWDSFDLNQAGDIQKLEEKLSLAAQVFVENKDRESKTATFVRNNKRFLPLALAASILLNAACGKVGSARELSDYEKTQTQISQELKNVEHVGWSDYNHDMYDLKYNPGRSQEFKEVTHKLIEWKRQHPETGSVDLQWLNATDPELAGHLLINSTEEIGIGPMPSRNTGFSVRVQPLDQEERFSAKTDLEKQKLNLKVLDQLLSRASVMLAQKEIDLTLSE
jgi:hypothetical protein